MRPRDPHSRVATLALAVALVLALLVGTVWYLEKQLAASGSDSRGGLPLELRALKERVTDLADGLSKVTEGIARIEASTEALDARIAGLEESLRKLAERPAPPPPPPPARPARLVPAFKDDFEQDITNWMVPPADGLMGTVAPARGEGVARTGQGALRLSYTYAQGKIAMSSRMVANHRDLVQVDLWVRCEKGKAMLFVGATDAALATYGVTVPVEAEAGWQHVVVDFADMEFVHGQRDPGGRLDATRVIALGVGDVTPDGQGGNALLIDDFTALRPAKPGEAPGDF